MNQPNNSTTSSIVNRATTAQTLWGMTFPQGTAPQPRQFILWAKRFSDEQIEQAFLKVSRKFASQDAEPDAIQRYVTGLLLNLEREGTTSL